jgi:hypothetical protein
MLKVGGPFVDDATNLCIAQHDFREAKVDARNVVAHEPQATSQVVVGEPAGIARGGKPR